MLFGIPTDVMQPLAILLLSQFILFLGVGAVIPSIPLYGKEIGLSSAANGIVISAPAVALLLAAKSGGTFADRGRRPAMLIGMAVIAASDVGTALATSIAPLVVARLGLGLGRCVSEAGERGMLADLAGRVPDVRGRILAAQQAVVALGIAIGAPFGGVVVEQYGPRASFLCVSAAAIVALLMYCFLPETTGINASRQLEGELQKSSASASASGGAGIDTDMGMATDMAAETNKRTSFIESIFIAPPEAVESATGPQQQKKKRTQQQSQQQQQQQQLEEEEEVGWGELLQNNSWKGLALCQVGATFGFAAKIASIPILATAVLPGGAAGAGALVSACGLSGLLGAPFGGWLTDRTDARFTALVSGVISSVGLMAIPLALNGDVDAILHTTNSLVLDAPLLGGQLTSSAIAFTLVVLGWSLGATAQGPALTAFAQEMAPLGSEATALALPRAAGDAAYIVAPFLLGLAADSMPTLQGVECAFAGLASLIGVALFLALSDSDGDGVRTRARARARSQKMDPSSGPSALS